MLYTIPAIYNKRNNQSSGRMSHQYEMALYPGDAVIKLIKYLLSHQDSQRSRRSS